MSFAYEPKIGLALSIILEGQKLLLSNVFICQKYFH